jgi:hypothetical protein
LTRVALAPRQTLCCSTYSVDRLSPGAVRSLSKKVFVSPSHPRLTARYRGQPAKTASHRDCPRLSTTECTECRMFLEPGRVAACNQLFTKLSQLLQKGRLFVFLWLSSESSKASQLGDITRLAAQQRAPLSLANREAYQKWPTRNSTFSVRLQSSKSDLLPI